MYSKARVIFFGLAITVGACGSATEDAPSTVGAPMGAAGGAAEPPTGSVGDPTPSPAGETPSDPGAGPAPSGGDSTGPTEPTAPGDPLLGAPYDHENEQVALAADLVVAAGTTLRVGPGTTFTAQTGVAVRVEGTLLVEGTLESPVRFLGAGTPNSWHGIVVASGGLLDASHLEIGGATYGLHAQPGSDFAIDHADLGTSFKAAVVESDGTFDYVAFHASGNPLFSPVNEASIDDVNGTLTILNASPTITNSTFDNSAALVDMIRVGGSSVPVFDHIRVTQAHCAIHTFGDTNSHPKITNSVFEGLAYGFMAYATGPIIEDSVFLNNASDVGFCFGATVDSRPLMTGNYYSSGSVLADPSCFQVMTTDGSPATTPNPMAGPLPE